MVAATWDVCAEDLKQGAEGVTCHCVRRCSLDRLDLRSNRGCCHACYDLAGNNMIARPEQRDTFANDYHSGLARTSAPNDSLQREYTVARLQECLLCLRLLTICNPIGVFLPSPQMQHQAAMKI